MSLVLKVACPSCGSHQDSLIGNEIRCQNCGNDFRAFGHGESSTRIVSATPDELEHVPYSQRSTEVPRSSASSLILSDPALLDDRMLRDLPMRDNAHWCGRVRLVKKLGQGGMGAVYRGFDESLAVDVAVKILPVPPGGKELHFADRFRMEARISAQITSANVVRTRDVGEQGEVVYLVMDFIDGQTARQMLDLKGLIPVPHALQIVHDASLGMQAAHERGIVHRDIKPENILVANDGRVLLSDLGLAKASGSRISDSLMPITRMGLLLGTPEYMSPEQWDIGAHITPRSDIWAMGVTLWVLLTRRAPFQDADLGQLSKKIKEAPLPDIHTLRPDVPPQVAQILYHCMAKNPQRRYMNAAALVSALSQAMLHPEQMPDDFVHAPQPSSMSLSSNHETPQETRSAVVSPAAPPRAPSTRHVSIPYVEPPRAMPTPIGPASRPKPKTEVIVRRKKTTLTRKLAWASVPAAAACAAFAYYHFAGFNFNPNPAANNKGVLAAGAPHVEPAVSDKPKAPAPPAPAPEVALDVSAPKRVKFGETVLLSATLKGVDDPSKYKLVWKSGKDEPQVGTEIAVLFDKDKDFDVAAVRLDTRKETLLTHVHVETDLAATAVSMAGVDENAPARLEGTVSGGPGLDKIEFRWYDAKSPNEILCDKIVFEPPDTIPGSRIYVFQARRKGARDWAGAATDKVGVVVAPKVPVAFTAAMKDAARLLKEAETAENGSAAQAALSEALKAFDKAQTLQPANPDVNVGKADCLRRAKAEDEYAKLMSDCKESVYAAELIKEADPYEKVKALEKARQQCYDAQLRLKAQEIPASIRKLQANTPA